MLAAVGGGGKPGVVLEELVKTGEIPETHHLRDFGD